MYTHCTPSLLIPLRSQKLDIPDKERGRKKSFQIQRHAPRLFHSFLRHAESKDAIHQHIYGIIGERRIKVLRDDCSVAGNLGR